MMKATQYTALALALMGTAVVNAQTQVPNSFQPGQPARAAEVNENFDILETAIDQNAVAIQNIPAGPPGPQGPQGLQGPVGPMGPEGPPGADLSDEVSIIQGEQIVQNDRINSLDDSVQENTLAISGLLVDSGVKVYGGGTELGRFFALPNLEINASYMWVLSPTGYIFRIDVLDPTSQTSYLYRTEILFSEPSCAGNAFVEDAPQYRVPARLGTVFSGDNTTSAWVYYAPRGSTPITTMYRSWVRDGVCVENSGTFSMIPVLPNDSAVTGVPSMPPSGAISVGTP